MEIQLLFTKTGELLPALIEKATLKDMLLKKDGWNFNWRGLYKNKESEFFKITLEKTSGVLEGIIMISLVNDEMVVMNNVEIAPHNIGSKGKYEDVAGCLIAYCCKRSKEIGKNNYKGFVSFDSKTQLISHYQNKYGATYAMGQKMFFTAEVGEELIEKYLNQ